MRRSLHVVDLPIDQFNTDVRVVELIRIRDELRRMFRDAALASAAECGAND